MSGPDSTRDVGQDDFLFHLYRGSELLQDDRILEAKQELEQALTMQPRDAKGQDLLGTVYFRLGLYPHAIQIYEALESQHPADVSIKINLALCYLKTGQPEPARRVLRDAVQISPDHKRAWGYLGLALQKLGDFEQAQIAFERGGRVTMARRMTLSRQPPPVVDPRPSGEPPSGPDVSQVVRDMAQTAFMELDAGELRFALAEPASALASDASDGQWHTVELGEMSKTKAVPRSPYSKTLPPPWMGELEPERSASLASQAPPSLPMPPPLYVPPSGPPMAMAAPPPRAERDAVAPPLFAAPAGRSVTLDPSGVLLVQTGAQTAFAARLDALRVVAGAATTRVLHRRSRDADTGEVLGGLGSPVVRVDGDVRLVLGARPGQTISLLTVEESLAFVREDLLLGFELRLTYENGRLSLDPTADPGGEAAAREGVHVVQLRGTGVFALELAGKIASVPSVPGRPLLVRREWVVGWSGAS